MLSLRKSALQLYGQSRVSECTWKVNHFKSKMIMPFAVVTKVKFVKPEVVTMESLFAGICIYDQVYSWYSESSGRLFVEDESR